jgi:guanosine-diphosphatase
MQGRMKIHQASLKIGHSPCLADNVKISFQNSDLKGSAKTGADQCLNMVSKNLFDKNSGTCSVSPCSFDGVYMPKITTSHELYAFSYFFDKFANPFQYHAEFLVGHVKTAAHSICSSSPPKDLGFEGTKELQKNTEWCTDLSYIYSLLSIGYELPDDRKILSTKKVNGIEIGWSLGCAIKMLDKFNGCDKI